ncbi:MAG: transglutaminase family protein [Bacteroidia bacterium]
MMNKPTLLLLLFFTPLFFFAQTDYDQLPPSKLEALQEAYPEEEFVLLNAEINYTFEMEDGKPVGYKEVRETIANLESYETYSFGAVFDEFSTVEELNKLNRKGKPQKITIATASYEHEGIFYDDSKVSWLNARFGEEGTIISFVSKVKYTDLRFITTSYFHENMPVEKKVITYEIPDWLDIEVRRFNFDKHTVTVNETEGKGADIQTFTMIDMAPDDPGDHTAGPSHYLPHMLILAKSYSVNGRKVTLFESTADLYKWYRRLFEEMKPDQEAIKKLAADIIKGAQTDREKAEKIFFWVKDNIRYVAFEDGIAGYQPAEPNSVVKKAYGDCKGMACLTSSLMNEAGLDARPTWIGTRRIAYDYSIPSLAVDNHMITCLMLDGERIFLDATETYMGFGEYANRIQGRPVLIYDKENYILDTIPEYDHLYNTYELNREMEIVDGGSLKGFSRRVYKGESKNNILAGVRNTRTEDREERLKNYLARGDRNYVVDEVTHSPLDAELPLLVLEHNFELKNAVSSFGNELYINFQTDETFSGMEIEDERLSDYVLSSKFHKVIRSKIKVPEGYALSYSPEPVSEVKDGFEIQCKVSQDGNHLIIEKTLSVPGGTITKDQAPAFRKAIEKLEAFYKEQLVLKKG